MVKGFEKGCRRGLYRVCMMKLPISMYNVHLGSLMVPYILQTQIVWAFSWLSLLWALLVLRKAGFKVHEVFT